MPKISIIIFILVLISQLLPLSLQLGIGDSATVGSALRALPVAAGAAAMQVGVVLKNLLLISSLLSLIIGTIVGLAQSRIKRLLACQVN